MPSSSLWQFAGVNISNKWIIKNIYDLVGFWRMGMTPFSIETMQGFPTVIPLVQCKTIAGKSPKHPEDWSENHGLQCQSSQFAIHSRQQELSSRLFWLMFQVFHGSWWRKIISSWALAFRKWWNGGRSVLVVMATTCPTHSLINT